MLCRPRRAVSFLKQRIPMALKIGSAAFVPRNCEQPVCNRSIFHLLFYWDTVAPLLPVPGCPPPTSSSGVSIPIRSDSIPIPVHRIQFQISIIWKSNFQIQISIPEFLKSDKNFG